MWTCGGCTAKWSGLAVAHCGACHRTFSTVGLFDKHRSPDGDHGSCRHPEDVTGRNGQPVLFWRGGMWRGRPMNDTARGNFERRENAGTDTSGDV